MQCQSCGRPVPVDICPHCGDSPPRSSDSTARDRTALLPDGGERGDDEDSPASSGDDADETGPEETYLSPDEIVADDIAEDTDDIADEPTDEGGRTDDPSTGTAVDESAVDDADDTDDGDGPAGADVPPAGPSTDDVDRPDSEERVDSEQFDPDEGIGGEPSDGYPAEPGSTGEDEHAGGTGERSADRLHQGSQPRSHEMSAGAGVGGGGADGAGGGTGGHAGGLAGSVSGEAEDIVERIREFPLRLGTALGTIAFLVPYIVVTIAALWAYEESPLADPEMGAFDVGAEVFMTVAGLGSGQRVVDLFIGMADVASPGEVDASNYPTVESQLDALLGLFETAPEVPLLVVYVAAPYVLFVSGRYLARHYAPRDSALDRVLAGTTVALGTFPVVLLVGLVFEVFDLLARLVFVGLFLPAAVGALGGLSIVIFDRRSALVSTLFGWTAIGAGVVVSTLFVSFLGFDLPDGVGLELSILDQLVLGLGAYLNVVAFEVAGGLRSWLLFVLVVILTVGAGFFRTWRLDERFESRMEAALVGSSIWLGFVATVALFLWLFPMSTILVDVSLAGDGLDLVARVDAAALSGLEEGGVDAPMVTSVVSVGSYLHAIVVAGFLFPAMFGGIGGYLAALAVERQQRQ